MKFKSAVLCLSLSCFLLTSVIADKEFCLEDHLPKSTLFMMSVPDIQKIEEQIQHSFYSQLFRDPGILRNLQLGWKFVEEAFATERQHFQQMYNIAPKELLAMLQGEVTLALIDLEMKPQAPPMIDFICAISLKGDFPKAKKWLEQQRQRFFPRGVREIKIGNTSFYQLPTPIPAYLGFIDQSLVLATNKQRLAAILNNQQENSLQETAGYQAICEASQTQFVRVHLRLKELLAKAFLPPPLTEMFHQLGIAQVQTISCSSGLSQGDLRHYLRIEAPGERQGVLRLFTFPQLTGKLLQKVPSDAEYYETVGMDLVGWWEGLNSILTAIPPTAPKWKEALAKIEKDLEISIRDDLLAPFGEEMALFTAPPSIGQYNDLVACLELKDFQQFLGNFQQIVQKAPYLELRHTSYRGSKIYYVFVSRIGQHEKNKMLRALYAPLTILPTSFVEKEGKLYLSNSTFSLKRHLRFLATQEKTSLNVTLPENCVAYSYIDTPAGFGGMYNNLAQLGQPLVNTLHLIPDFPIELDLASLPIFEDYASKLEPTLVTLQDHQGVLSLDIKGSMIGSLLAFLYHNSQASNAIIGIQAAMLLPALSNVEEKANQIKSQANLDQLGKCCILYQLDFGRGVYYPPSLEELYHAQILWEKEILLCPGGEPEDTHSGIDPSLQTHYKWLHHNRLNSSYDYSPYPKTQGIIAYSTEFPDVTIFLFMDGHTEVISNDDPYLDELFDKQIQLLAEHGVEANREQGVVKVHCNIPKISQTQRQQAENYISNADLYSLVSMGPGVIPVCEEALQSSQADEIFLKRAIALIKSRSKYKQK